MKTTTNHGLKKPDGTDTVNIEDLNYNADKLDTLLVPATTTVNGLMSKDDKTKLNGIATGANKTVLNNTVTSTSTSEAATANAVKTVYDLAASKAASSHTHDDRYYSESEVDTKLNTKANTSHTHTKSQITDFPSSIPANGGNADTVGGISAGDLIRISQGQTITGTKEFISQSVGSDFSNAIIQVREAQSVGGNNRTVEYAPSIGFHWSNTGAGSIAMHSDGNFYFRAQGYTESNPMYRNVMANDFVLPDGTSVKSKLDELKKSAGDYMGKDIVLLTKQALSLNIPFTYTNSKGGILRVETPNTGVTTTITVDGSVISSGRAFSDICNLISSADGYYGYELIIPFNSSVSLTPTSSGIIIYPVAYVNK